MSKIRSKAMDRAKVLSFLSQVLIFGGIYGEITKPELFKMWIAFALIGGLFLAVKNRIVHLRKYKRLTVFLEILSIVMSILIAFIPDISSGVRQILFLIIAISFIAYYNQIFFKYYTDTPVEPPHN